MALWIPATTISTASGVILQINSHEIFNQFIKGTVGLIMYCFYLLFMCHGCCERVASLEKHLLTSYFLKI